jgi:2-keto-4-pentenoate hydratase/2-oxohepta-3-ene-1,7-dioic acid hydratase in catechol pathway
MQPVTFNGQSIRPGKVVCIGKNYAAHIAEMASVPADDMVVFMKPATAIGEKLISVMNEPLHYEGEICLMMLDGQVDGSLRQKGDVSLMLYPPLIILQELAQFCQLEDYDIVMTGTPAGVGMVQAGECFQGRILDGDQELVCAEWTAV